MKIYWFAFLAFIVLELIFSGCEDIFIDGKFDNDAVKNFDELWKTVDENYSFFSLKNIDWDSAYAINRPKVFDGMPTDSLFTVMAGLMNTLRDGHVNLFAGFDVSRNWQWYLDYPQNFDFTLIERNYLKDNYQITGPLYHTLIDSIGYVYYESFDDNVSGSVMDYLVSLYSSRVQNDNDTIIVKGLIIDVRNNGGGSLNNARTMASRFATEKTLVHYWQYKNGPGHNDFTEKIPKYIEPEGENQFQGLVILLTNRYCYSSTNFFVQYMKAVVPKDRLLIIGDQTGGGGGLPINRELPNGWIYRFSSTKTTTVGGEDIELGIKPDLKLDLNDDDKAENKDTLIERALGIIKNSYEKGNHGG